MISALALLLASPALALPPSTTLTGPEGTLSWTTRSEGRQVRVEGTSPAWRVVHLAHPDLRPIRTERTDADGRRITIDYASDHVVVHLPGRDVRHDEAGVWDGDTLDVRLGHELSAGRTAYGFRGVDTSTGKLYSFEVEDRGATTCGPTPCRHLVVQLTGLLRYVGPTWSYWYDADGRLLRFQGPAGDFSVESP